MDHFIFSSTIIPFDSRHNSAKQYLLNSMHLFECYIIRNVNYKYSILGRSPKIAKVLHMTCIGDHQNTHNF